MNVLHVIIFGYVFTTAFITGECEPETTSSKRQIDNFIGFVSAPDKLVDGSAVHVRYRCIMKCRLAVEVVVSTLRKRDLVIFRQTWTGSPTRASTYRIHQVLLGFPPSILYQHDIFNRNVFEADKVTVRAWLGHLEDGSGPVTYSGSMLKIYKELQITPLSERPTKHPTACPSWSAQLMWQMNRNRISQCQYESDKVDVLSFPLAGSGEQFGMVVRFQPFMDETLESARLHAVPQASVALSVWIYLLKWCHKQYCAIIHHVDRNNSYDSILMQLTDTGHIIIQAHVAPEDGEAFQANVQMPLLKWIRLDCYIQESECLISFWNSCNILTDGSFPAGKLQAIAVVVYTTWDNEIYSFPYKFQKNIHYDDTDGYFVIGGSKYMPSIHGYFGPFKYYRLGTDAIENPLQSHKTLLELDKTHRECQEIKVFTRAFLKEVTESHRLSAAHKGVCIPHFIRLRHQFVEKVCTQAWTWEMPLKYSTLFSLLQRKASDLREGQALGMRDLVTTLFKKAVKTMFPVDQVEIKITSKSKSLLQASSCFGNHEASLLLASIHLAGLGHVVDQHQGHVYSLIGASGDNLLALMHAGYKHTQGIDGFPKNFDMAYNYYSNAGAQSYIDNGKLHENKQSLPEYIYLSNQDDVNSLVRERSDIVHFLKLRAERGDLESQRHLGVLLFWGQNGIAKDVARAVKWFERSAMQMKDHTAVYDYSILLIKGHGVKRNTTRGFQLLKKAAEMGSINALNGLGWYHGIILNDHKNAVKYFEQAALNGSDDGMYNLGVYYIKGKGPSNLVTNETAAFQLFLNASQSGHVAASVEVAWYLSTGNLAGVSRDVERAVIMLKKVCEENGHLGFIISKALEAYLEDSKHEALIKYVLAAESGMGLAQSNAAYLCQELNLSGDCQWRYQNHSTLNYDPHPSALLRMGDHYYDSSCTREDSLSMVGQAVSMYSRAALAGSPQGMYSLAVLAQEYVLPLSVLHFFNMSQHREDSVVERILKSCVATEQEETISPCFLALLRVQMGKALSSMSQNGAQLLLAYASLLSVGVLIVVLPLQSCLRRTALRRSAVELRTRTSSDSQDGVSLNREQDGIMGGSDRVAGNLWLTIVNGGQWLGQICDLAVTLSGVCLCAFWTTFVYHLL